ncbi:MAG: cbb3-type cytochrome c oxidase subunit II [Cyanobacteria bacterium]|nr:cbb3-type cytochrome c oxidase subunit II [Cyanobacteriota bacterium]
MDQRLNYLIAGMFVLLTFITIIFVTTLLPAWTFKPEASAEAVVYTALETEGRNIYRREGCFYCHSQFVRYQDPEMGEMVKAGDYVHETPHVLGTERTGPDLSNVGGKYPSAWHWAHHIKPRAVKPGSIMPSYSYLTEHEMTALVAYLQTLGKNRKLPQWIVPPQEYRDRFAVISEKVNVKASAIANAGRGIYMQNCAQCHGVAGRGNGPVSMSMMKKPANFTRPYYAKYRDDMWFWRVAEGVPGSRMPRWDRSLSDEDMLYLVAYLRTLPRTDNPKVNDIEVSEMSQLDDPNVLDHNFWQIESLNPTNHGGGDMESRYAYGGGRGD